MIDLTSPWGGVNSAYVLLFCNLTNIFRSFIELSWMQKKHLDEIKLCSEDSPKNSLEFRLFTRKSFLLWGYEYSWIRKILFVRLFAGGLWCYADFLCEMMFVWQMDSNQFWVGWSSEIRDLKIVSLFIWWMDALQKIFDFHRNRASHRVWLTNQSMSKRSCLPPRYDGWWWKGCWGEGYVWYCVHWRKTLFTNSVCFVQYNSIGKKYSKFCLFPFECLS